MENKRVDRRVKYTKMVIKDSFIKFLEQKPISKISVKEICDEADINRATFYAHYTDQFDLLYKIEKEVIEDIKEYIKNYDYKGREGMPFEMTEKILEYVKENSKLIGLLLNLNGDKIFQQELIKIIGDQHFNSMLENSAKNSEDAEYMFHFLASGSVGIIQKWLKEGTKKSPKELSEIILKMAINGRSAFE